MYRIPAFILSAGLFTVCAIGAGPASTSTPARTSAPAVTPDPFASTVEPFVKKNCLMCHNDKAKVGGLTLAPFHSTAAMVARRDLWERVSQRVKNGEMPPKGIPRPSATEVASVTGWIDSKFADVDRLTPPDPGRVTAHRLNKFEYNNSIHDLFGVDVRPADDFPADDSGYGFDNIGDVLSISPVLMEKYLTAAEKVARAVVSVGATPKPTRERVSADHDEFAAAKMPVGEHIQYQFLNEADYKIRAGIRGKREPLRVTLWIDNLPVKDAEFDSHDDEAPRFLEYAVHLSAGMHRIGAQLTRVPNIAPLPHPPDLRFISLSQARPSQPPPPTPWIDYIEFQGPYKPLPQPPTDAQKRLFVCSEKTESCAREILRSLAYRAWRRPVTEAEITKVASFVGVAQRNGDTFEQGMRLAMEAILVSPDFLFRVEHDPNPQDASLTHPVSDYDLASRLSFFLWSSVPDAELLHQAQEKQLHKPEVLHREVERMMQDGKSERFVDNFAGQWLELRNLDGIAPDPEKFPQFKRMRTAMKTETRMFFEAVLRDDKSILDFIDGKYTFLNERLAKFYGIPGVTGPEFRRVDLDGTERSGVLTQASVLTVSSYPTRTSPVIRGKWILENFLNAPPPPPPPNVPALNDSGIGTKLSMRQQLEEHRANPVCASCHSKMDPLGFGLENYNAIGQWRDADGKFPIDSTGTLPTGKSFKGPEELKAVLKSDPKQFAQCLTEKLLTYALGRGLERYDRPAVAKIVDHAAANNYKFSDLLFGVVDSLPFEMRRGEGERHVTQTIATASHP